MLTLCRLLFSSLLRLVPSRAALQAEIFTLRHQLQVLERSTGGRRRRLRTADRIFRVWLSRLWTGWRSCVRIFQPATLAWNRKGFRLYGTWKSRMRQGRPRRPARSAISYENQLDQSRLGRTTIHGELLKLGIDIGETTVAKYMVHPVGARHKPGQHSRRQ